MKVGDIVEKFIPFYGTEYANKTPRRGEVIYIHPERRFFVVKFDYRGQYEDRSFCESFSFR